MGQYHMPFNLDKKEFLRPHVLGNGLKLYEQAASSEGVCAAVCMLLAACNGRGGGDFPDQPGFIGRWVGDRVVWIGDYAQPNDIPDMNARVIYEMASADPPMGGWKDISGLAVKALEQTFEFTFVGEGWRHRHYRTGEWDCRHPDGTTRCHETAHDKATWAKTLQFRQEMLQIRPRIDPTQRP